MTKFTFNKTHKLTRQNQFRNVLAHKCCARHDLFDLYVCPNNLDFPRFAVSISARSASAVTRNRLKRLAREAFRLARHDIPPAYDYLLIYTRKMSKNTPSDAPFAPRKLTFEQINAAFRTSVEKAVQKSTAKTRGAEPNSGT